MNNRDWEQFGNDIFRTVQDAIESCNYDTLNQNVSDAVNQVVDSVSQGVKRTREHLHQAKQNTTNQYEYYGGSGYNYQQTNARQKQPPVPYGTNVPSRAGSIVMTTFGGIITGFSFVWLILFLVSGILFGAGELFIGGAFAAVVLSGGAFLLSKGIKSLCLIGRFKKYLKAIGQREYCGVQELIDVVGKPAKFVLKDLKKMIKKGWFREGHLDQQKTTFMLTDSMYAQYQQLEAQKSELQKEEAKRMQAQREAEAMQAEYRKGLSPDVQKVVEQGDAYVRKIRELNDIIPGEEVSAKMDRMEMIVDRIFDRVEEHPESVNDIRKLMEYYLPTTIKLLEAYAQMDAQPIGGENIESAKKEIEATLDTLNIAFEKILDSLFQETAWDVSSDISVLNTILAQEGLKEDGLKR